MTPSELKDKVLSKVYTEAFECHYVRRKMLYQQLYFGYMLADSDYINWMNSAEECLRNREYVSNWGVEAALAVIHSEIEVMHGCLDADIGELYGR